MRHGVEVTIVGDPSEWICLKIRAFKCVEMNKFIACFVILLGGCDAAKILGFLPYPGTSHQRVFLPLLGELARKGHTVTVASYYPQNHDAMPPQYRNISTYRTILYQPKPGTPLRGKYSIEDRSGDTWRSSMTKMRSLVQDYDIIIRNNDFNQTFADKYDIVLAEYFESDLFLGYVSKMGTPFILLTTTDIFPWQRDTLGDPISPSLIQHTFSKGSNLMDFPGRFWNTVEIIQILFYYRFVTLPAAQNLAEKYLGPLTPLNELTKNASLIFTNSHHSLLGPRPMNPSTVEVGGLHVFPPNELPTDLKTLMDKAKNGIIYFSMGSLLKGSTMSSRKRDDILKVFSELKETVLWKWEEDLPNKPSNLHTSSWFPQRDVFAHPNLVLYIGHCGLLGIHEALTEALPIICFPLFGDQQFNAGAIEKNGMGLSLNYADITENSFRDIINQVLKTPSFKENAKRVSAAFLDRPMSAMDTAVYWTEYVIRHKGAPHLKTPARFMTWWEYYNLDVLGTLFLSALTVVVLTYNMLKAVLLTLFCQTGYWTKVKKS